MTQPTLKPGFNCPSCGAGPAVADRRGRHGMQERRKPLLEQIFD